VRLLVSRFLLRAKRILEYFILGAAAQGARGPVGPNHSALFATPTATCVRLLC
jgi:hypothetical protein